jgi:hypothetical protein
MNLPASLFISGIRTKEVFYFSTNKINTGIPHYFICIKKDESEILLFSCCTTKGDKREEYITKMGISLETLVYIKPGEDGNPFNDETYVDCNKAIPFTIEEFEIMHKSGKIDYKGEISDDHYIQIIIGLLKSPQIEQSIKDTLPNPDTI